MRGALDDNFPNDLRKAIEASPRVSVRWGGRTSALAFRTTNMKTLAGRAKRIAGLVDMLERGETPLPGASLRSLVLAKMAALLRQRGLQNPKRLWPHAVKRAQFCLGTPRELSHGANSSMR
jgi:hypothetical protein